MTTRYLENTARRCQTVSIEGRCANAIAGARTPLTASGSLDATTGGAAFMATKLRAMQAMRGIVATHIAVEHHAFRFGHQHAASMTLDHRFRHIGWYLRFICTTTCTTGGGFAGFFAQTFEQNPADHRNDHQKNYFSHCRRQFVGLLERLICMALSYRR